MMARARCMWSIWPPGRKAPSQRVLIDGKHYLRVLAADVPSVGYKVFEIRPGLRQSFPNAASVTGNEIENSVYRLTVDGRGAITSLIDKTRGNRQFVRTIHGRAINDLGAGSGNLEVENVGPVSVTLKATSPAVLSHTTRITLLKDSRRIEIRNEITQNFHSVGDSPPRVGLQLRSEVAGRAARGGRGGHPRQAACRRRALLAEPRPL